MRLAAIVILASGGLLTCGWVAVIAYYLGTACVGWLWKVALLTFAI